MSHDRERERGGDDGYDNVQQNYYQRSWGDHPDLRSLDGRSQASEGQGETSHIAFCSVLFCSVLSTLYCTLLNSNLFVTTASVCVCPLLSTPSE